MSHPDLRINAGGLLIVVRTSPDCAMPQVSVIDINAPLDGPAPVRVFLNDELLHDGGVPLPASPHNLIEIPF